MLNKMKMEANGNGSLNLLQIYNYPANDTTDRDFEIIGECRELKRLAGREDFDIQAHQDQIWRIADRIQLLIESI